MKLDLAAVVREDFPILQEKKLIYFDSAATSQKPFSVIKAISDFYAHEYGTVHRAIYQLAGRATERYNKVREQVAQFIGAKHPEEIVFTRGTTDSINLVAQSFGSLLVEGDEILISEMEHHSNIVPWQLLAQRKKVILKVIPVNERAELDLTAFRKLLTPRTKILAIAHVANSTGTINQIEEMIPLAHASGAKVLIDAAQSAAHLPIDVEKLDIDFLAFSGHKAYGPTGIGILYGKAALLAQMPPIQGGGDMIEQVTLEKTTFQEAPLKFEAGTPPIAQVIGLSAALDYIHSLGLENIREWEHSLLLYATEKLQAVPGLKVIGTAERKGSIISFTIPGLHPLDIASFLDLEGIAIRSGHHCAQPLMKRFGLTATCRISFAPFNTFEEIDLCVAALKKAMAILH